MSDANPCPSVPRTSDELFAEAQTLLDEVVRNALRPWGKHQHQDDVDQFKQRMELMLLEKNKKRLCDFRQEAGLKTWLQKLISREVNQVLLKEKRHTTLDDLPSEKLFQAPPQAEELLQRERKQKVDAVLPKLTRHQQELYELFRQGEKTDEIARRLGIKVSSVHRMRAALVKRLGELVNGGGGENNFLNFNQDFRSSGLYSDEDLLLPTVEPLPITTNYSF